ncbi:hypothetical protein CRUP_001870 [Coryphaenoides rupestris]|nr:hypothetical protein CRUP_001870 [Coryphaenoides rupestris]
MWLMEDSMRRSCEAWMSSSCSTLLARALIWYATLARDWVVYALVSSRALRLSWAWVVVDEELEEVVVVVIPFSEARRGCFGCFAEKEGAPPPGMVGGCLWVWVWVPLLLLLLLPSLPLGAWDSAEATAAPYLKTFSPCCPGVPSMAQQRAEDTASHLEARFDAAVRVIRSLPEDGPYQPSDNMMLMFYSYYKQATLGPCSSPRPIGFWDSRGKAKWDAWSSLGNMTKEEAMMNYVDDIQLILDTIPVSEEVSELVEKLGTFYADVDGADGPQQEETNEMSSGSLNR